MIKIIILMFSVNAVAGYEIEAKASTLNYKLGELYSFPVNLYQVGASYSDYFTYSILAGQSSTQYNHSNGPRISARIRNFWVGCVKKSLSISNNLSVFIGVNYTEYKEDIGGYSNSDTDAGYSYGAILRVSRGYAIRLEQTQYYRKRKERLGIENTKGLGVSIVWIVN